MKLSTGVDLIEIHRVEEALQRHGAQFLNRIFTPAEQDTCKGRIPSLAARFAAKEAVAKALGTGIGNVSWQDIEVLGDENNVPRLFLHGAGKEIAEKLGLYHWSVSLSHTHEHAIAFVVASE